MLFRSQTYANKGDLVLQFYADDGTLAEKARQHERHILIVDCNEVLVELPTLGGH